MALGSTHPLTDMSTRNLPRGKGRPARKADNLTAVCEPTVYKMSERRPLTNLWVSMTCYGDSFTYLIDRANQSYINKNRPYDNGLGMALAT
jgi:hypothetical protein